DGTPHRAGSCDGAAGTGVRHRGNLAGCNGIVRRPVICHQYAPGGDCRPHRLGCGAWPRPLDGSRGRDRRRCPRGPDRRSARLRGLQAARQPAVRSRTAGSAHRGVRDRRTPGGRVWRLVRSSGARIQNRSPHPSPIAIPEPSDPARTITRLGLLFLGDDIGGGHMTKARMSVLVLLLVASSPALSRADVGLLRTAQALDEARGYCLDIAGFGATLRLDDPLQAHTCKYGSELDDQRFEPIAGGAIRTGIGDRCLAATALEPGAKLVVRSCTSAATQRWTLTWGR